MPTTIWHGQVEGGRLHFDRRADFDLHAATLDGKRFELTIRKERHPLSRNQRQYLHGVVLPVFAEALGNDPAYLKAVLKLKFLWDGETVDKAGLPVVPSTEDLDKLAYGNFIDQIIRLAAECRCVIPEPGGAE